MLKSNLRFAPRKKAERKKTSKSDSHFLTKTKTKSNSKLLFQVASVYEIARFRRTPSDVMEEFFSTTNSPNKIKRPRPTASLLWASLEKSSEEVIREIFEDALRRDPLNRKEWVVLVDGDPHQIQKF